jgi:SRSO17 transposase
MDHRRADDSESRFAAYVEGLVSVIGHADRARPLRDYCMGLMMPCERKSVEPMAAVTAPALVGREGFSQGPRDGVAGDTTTWAG